MQGTDGGWAPKAFGGGSAESLLSPLMAMALVVCAIGVLALPRKYAITLLFLGALLIPPWAVIVIGGLHFPGGRVLSLAGVFRLLSHLITNGSGHLFGAGWTRFDTLLCAWAFFRALAFICLYHTGGAVVSQCGFLLTTVGLYLVIRYLFRDANDISLIARIYTVICLLNALEMITEQFGGTNLFASLCGTTLISEVRLGRVRSQGAFAHPLLAGAWAATSAPLFIWLWTVARSRILAVLGLSASLVMVWTTATSTPLLAWLAGVGAVCLWSMRRRMRQVRWGILVFLVIAQCFMKVPVWFLVSHIDLTGGSSGYHRALLIDQFIRNVGDWWLFGTSDNSTWGYEMGDTSNGFVTEGVTGGLVGFGLYVALIAVGFSVLGQARKGFHTVREQWGCWLLGACLFSHTTALIGVSYWDQSQVSWLALLAMISLLSKTKALERAPRPLVVSSPALA